MRYLALAVTTRKPKQGSLTGLNRAEKAAELRRCTQQRAAEITRWLADQHLEDQVGEVISDNAMSVIFMEATPEVKKRLIDAPNVMAVSVVDEFPVQLLHHGS